MLPICLKLNITNTLDVPPAHQDTFPACPHTSSHLTVNKAWIHASYIFMESSFQKRTNIESSLAFICPLLAPVCDDVCFYPCTEKISLLWVVCTGQIQGCFDPELCYAVRTFSLRPIRLGMLDRMWSWMWYQWIHLYSQTGTTNMYHVIPEVILCNTVTC